MTRIGGMDRVRCPVCRRWRGVRLNGAMSQHGAHEDRCPGSGRPVPDAPLHKELRYLVPVRPVRISPVLARLVGTGRGVGRGNTFGQALAIESVRVAESVGRVPAGERLPRQLREMTR
jgi:hypothetical protein